jgi:hypothetical protein
MESIREALRQGESVGYREPRSLVVGPENWFTARELLGSPVEYMNGSHLRLEKSWDIQFGFWYVEFENGRMVSVFSMPLPEFLPGEL